MTKNTQSKLKKIGLPVSYVAITAFVIQFICQNLNVCD